MGVKIQDLVFREKIDFSRLEGRIIAIDAPNIVMGLFTFSYKNKIYSYSDSDFMTDRTQRAISHLYGILFKINFYYDKKIFPIFCFDGRDSELKRLVTKDYLNDFRVVKNWYQYAIKSGKRSIAQQIAMGKEFLWNNIILESKQLLGALGVPYIESPASAESQCTQMVKQKIANYTNSQDFDCLLFGCPFIVQNLSKSLRRKVQGKWTYTKISPMSINLKKNLRRLNLDQFQLVDLAILVGTDYSSGVKGIGPKIALKLIKKHQSLEEVILCEKKKYNFDHLTPKLIKEVRKIFLIPEVIKPFELLYWDPPNKSRVMQLMCEDHTLNKKRVENNIDKVIKNYYKCRNFFKNNKNRSIYVQKTLDSVF